MISVRSFPVCLPYHLVDDMRFVSFEDRVFDVTICRKFLLTRYNVQYFFIAYTNSYY